MYTAEPHATRAGSREEKPEGGGEEEVRAKLEQDQLERQAWQRASESAGEDGLGLVFLGIYIPSVVPNWDGEGVYSLWPRALYPFRAPIL